MAQLRYVVLSIASAFLVLQLSEQVAANGGIAILYDQRRLPTACFGSDQAQFPKDKFFAAVDNEFEDLWNDGANCGKFLKMRCIAGYCKSGEIIRVKIVDRWRQYYGRQGTFAISEEAFAAIACLTDGKIVVQYCLDDEDAETFIAEVGHIGQ